LRVKISNFDIFMDNYYTNRRDFFAGIAAASAGFLTEDILSTKSAMANWGLISPGPVPNKILMEDVW